MPRGKPFTDIQGLQDARDAGFSNAEIAELFNINAITVVRHIGPENRRNSKNAPELAKAEAEQKARVAYLERTGRTMLQMPEDNIAGKSGTRSDLCEIEVERMIMRGQHLAAELTAGGMLTILGPIQLKDLAGAVGDLTAIWERLRGMGMAE